MPSPEHGGGMRRREFLGVLGGVAAWPLGARAQQSALPVVGFMSGRSASDSVHLVAAFREGLSEAGFVDGQNVLIEFRWANGQYDQLPALAAQLVSRPVAVLLGVGGDPSAIAAKRATSTIPIVFGIGSDPVKAGLVDSFNRPGANLTGYTLLTNEMESKRVGLLRELVPNAALVGVLLNPKFVPGAQQSQQIENAARTVSQKLVIATASSDEELSAAVALLVRERVNALLVAADPYFDTRRDQIIAFAAQNRLPAIYHFREFAAAGGLISYGPRITDGYRQAGNYTGQILKGAKTGDLPIQQPTKFDLVINLKTAKALAVPQSLQVAADELIE